MMTSPTCPCANPSRLSRHRRPQRGAVVVEFALGSLVFFTLLLAAFEFSRVQWMNNALIEATRLGARTASLCGIDAAPTVKARMVAFLPQLSTASIDVQYLRQDGGACTAAADCDAVSVAITRLTVPTFIPGYEFTPDLAGHQTRVPREYLNNNSPACT